MVGKLRCLVHQVLICRLFDVTREDRGRGSLDLRCGSEPFDSQSLAMFDVSFRICLRLDLNNSRSIYLILVFFFKLLQVNMAFTHKDLQLVQINLAC